MSSDFNPYAPPLAELDPGPGDSPGYCRDGELLRMTIGVRLPDRCIRCNESAGGRRLERGFFHRPVWWRWVAGLSAGLPFVIVMIDVSSQAMVAFCFALVSVLVADNFVRSKVVVGYGLCTRHRRLRSGLRGGFVVTWILLIGLAAAGANDVRAAEQWWFWTIAVAMFVLAIAASMTYRFTLVQLAKDQIWLRGIGRPFLVSLPALNE